VFKARIKEQQVMFLVSSRRFRMCL